MLTILTKGQSFVLYLMCVMIVTGIIKEKNSLGTLYNILCTKIKSKKLLVTIISALSGIMPIPGRVVVSAGILNTLSPVKNKNDWKLGIIDYLSTHHYYMWSPLEQSIIVIMAGLGLSYLQVLSYTWPLLLISLCFLIGYIYFKVDDEDISIVAPEKDNLYPFKKFLFPLLLSIGLIFKYDPAAIFSITAIYYIVITKTFNIKKIVSYINFKLVFYLFCIICISNFVKTYSSDLNLLLKDICTNYDINTICGISIISLIVFLVAFALGSSSKYAGILVILVSIFGFKYFVYFLAIEFSAYLLSPTHKCVTIGKMYFNTPLKKYYTVISLWSLTMIGYSLIDLLVK